MNNNGMTDQLDRSTLNSLSEMSEEDIFNSIFSPDDLDMRLSDVGKKDKFENLIDNAEKEILSDVETSAHTAVDLGGNSLSSTSEKDLNSELDAEREKRRESLKETDVLEDIAAAGTEENLVRTPEERVIISVVPDKMEAIITLLKPNSCEKPLTEEEIRQTLESYGIKKRIYDSYISRLAKTPIYDVPIRIASGEHVVEGTDGYLELYFTEESPNFKTDESGDVDFQDVEKLSFVKKGDELARIVPPVEGKDGFNVFGQTVRCRNVKPIGSPLGFGVELNEAGDHVIASISGEAMIRNNRISINNVIRLKNVDYSTGNIDFNGNVIVTGNVYGGFKVQCTGNLKVMGFVEEAHLKAGGNIEINSGMNGGKKREGSLTAGGKITCSFLENVVVTADGDLSIDSMINCIVTVKGNISALGKHGCIIGGMCDVNGNVLSQCIGNDAQVATKITICGKGSIAERRDIIQKQIDNDSITKTKLMSILSKVDATEQNPVKRDAAKARLADMIKKIEAEMRSEKDTIEALERKILTWSQKGFIKAGTVLYPNVTIEIADKRFINRKARYQCTIKQLEDGIHIISNGKEDEDGLG